MYSHNLDTTSSSLLTLKYCVPPVISCELLQCHKNKDVKGGTGKSLIQLQDRKHYEKVVLLDDYVLLLSVN